MGWMSQLHHSSSGAESAHIQQHSSLSSFLIGQAKMGFMLTRRKKTRSTDVDLEGLTAYETAAHPHVSVKTEL